MAHLVKPLAVCKLEKQSYDMGSQPKDRKVIRSGWTLCIEQKPEGGTLKYKVHAISRGSRGASMSHSRSLPYLLATTQLVPATESNPFVTISPQ